MATVVYVGGTSRSGSTMLHLILGNAANAFACGEAVSWFRPEKTHHFRFDCACGQSDCPVWSGLKEVPEAQFYAAAFKKLPIHYLVDSSKDISWLLDARRWTGACGIRNINVFIWKDPVDLAYSFWKREYKKTAWRAHFVKYFRRVQEAGLPILAVNYNELARAPQQKIAEICAAIDMPYFAGKERFWEKEQHHLFGSFGVRKQVQIGDSFIQPDKAFPPEFEEQLKDLREQIAKDAEVQEIVTTLRGVDVSVVERGVGARQKFQPPIPYPAWYYWHQFKRLWRQRFPRNSDLTKSKKVATIPISEEGDRS
ncbi:MAG: hypothetical protein EHM70_02545 [Chloroflexota bacterium]|nr:MAG: hypothetical protein EHM70_02545 [Chloroflexota bacterium]